MNLFKKNRFLLPFIQTIFIGLISLISKGDIYDIILMSFIVIFSFEVFYFSFSNTHKNLLRVFAIYIVCNYFIFPVTYLFLLKYESNSFQFDSTILESEKKESLINIIANYEPDSLTKRLKIINSIVSDTSKILENKFHSLNDGDIIQISNYIILQRDISVKGAEPRHASSIHICDKKGKVIFFIHDDSQFKGIYTASIRKYFDNYRLFLNKKIRDYKEETFRIKDKNKVWSYKQILPYTINIFSTSNMVPKSRIANFIFHFHQFWVITILVGLLVSFFQNFISEQKK